jgi:hypothetical protein
MTISDGVEWLCRPGLGHRGRSPRQALHLAGRYAEAADGFLRQESAWGRLAPSGGRSQGESVIKCPSFSTKHFQKYTYDHSCY